MSHLASPQRPKAAARRTRQRRRDREEYGRRPLRITGMAEADRAWPVLAVLLAGARSVKRTSLFDLSRGRERQAGRGVDTPGLRQPPGRLTGGRVTGHDRHSAVDTLRRSPRPSRRRTATVP